MSTLASEAKAFAKSSGYRFGDATSFTVGIHEDIILPGRCSPQDYLDDLGLKTVPTRVMVVCPGNGGLVAECYKRGANHVTLLEPRTRFHATLERVTDLLAQGWLLDEKKGLTYDIVTKWEFEDLELHDLILWSEGVEDTTQPKVVFTGLAANLSPAGSLVVEIVHGRSGWVERINSWRPSEDGIRDMADEIFGGEWISKQDGRIANRTIYTLKMVEGETPR